MKLQRTKEKRDGKSVYLMGGYEISFEKMSPGYYSNWNIERRWYIDNDVKPKVWGFKTLDQLKRFLDEHLRDADLERLKKNLKIYNEGGET
jgi:hypothetical protein